MKSLELFQTLQVIATDTNQSVNEKLEEKYQTRVHLKLLHLVEKTALQKEIGTVFFKVSSGFVY